ncbi:MAG: S46 family peptidase [Paludibacter sp.]|nr:S46 family peptidase [Paludibacter sp.]
MKKLFILLLSISLFAGLRADEGMWMLPLIQKLNIQKMSGMGLTMTAEDIYSDKNVSLKDAVVIFGNGCTGVMVSNQGLVFTNHHCGFDAIQQHSKVGHNYLKDGFTAENISDEIPSPGLSVKFLVKVQDVTERVISQLPDTLLGKKRIDKQDSIIKVIQNETEKGSIYIAKVKPFYSGNEFYLFVYEEFTDVRFAFAPPTSIGKFGGDTDNWMWPRHTGDFSVFRVYSDKDGKPAKYSKDNVPYSPKRFATISNQGYVPGDYTMILGNPGTTTRYLSSWGVNNRMKASNQARIDVRGAKQDVWHSFMRVDEAINIAYASKFARSSNYWKNSIGMNKAITKLGTLGQKQEQEKAFAAWMNATPERQAKYKNVLRTLEDGYAKNYPYTRAMNYLMESLMTGVEMPRIATQVNRLIKKNLPQDSLLIQTSDLYKDYYPAVDQATLVAMLDVYKKSVDADALPEVYTIIKRKFKGDYTKYAKYMFDKSDFTTLDKITKAIKGKKTDFSNDPAIVFANVVRGTMNNIHSDAYDKTTEQIKDAERLFENGIKAMAAETGKPMYPDANSTMRLTYGKVGGYHPADAVDYKYYTTTKGILEKEVPGDEEFDVSPKLKKTILENNYGAYLDQKTGEMHVAFLSDNDITGGNSGSPIFNAKGELLGLAFDGNWEAMSGDIVFEPNLQRTINVDVRYIMFVMDKIGGAKRLVDELSIK